jgi:hypothetical protein
VQAHFAPRVKHLEPGRLDLGLFDLSADPKACCLYFGGDAFLGTHVGYGAPVYRLVTIVDETLLIEDFSESLELADSSNALGGKSIPGVLFSNKYGSQLQ